MKSTKRKNKREERVGERKREGDGERGRKNDETKKQGETFLFLCFFVTWCPGVCAKKEENNIFTFFSVTVLFSL